MIHEKSIRNVLILILSSLIFGACLIGCAKEETKYSYAEIYLDCENYSNSNNDPGNCQVVPGTTAGLRVQEGMIVSIDYVEELMENLNWVKVSHTQKYKDVNGVSFRVDVYKFKRESN